MKKLTDKQREQLILGSNQVRKNAYAPYSRYKVGAALLGSSGRIYYGVNVENASFPLSICAERNAVFHAVAEGESDFQAIAVATDNGGTPCGACRQVLAEFGKDIVVLILNGEGVILQETTVETLLPGAFSGKDLEQ
jgi:cytidine deaminase